MDDDEIMNMLVRIGKNSVLSGAAPVTLANIVGLIGPLMEEAVMFQAYTGPQKRQAVIDAVTHIVSMPDVEMDSATRQAALFMLQSDLVGSVIDQLYGAAKGAILKRVRLAQQALHPCLKVFGCITST